MSKLVKHNPFELDRFFADPFLSSPSEFFRSFFENDSPYDKVRFSDDPESYRVEIDLPGVAKDGIDIDIVGRTIHIHAKRRVRFRGGEQQESFERSFTVQKDGDVDNVQGELNDGVLVITVPRIQRETIPKKKLKLK